MQVVPLTLISPHEPKEFTLNLVKNQNLNDPHNKKPRGQLTVELSYHPLKEDSHRLSGPLERHESQSSESEVIERPKEEASQNCQAGLLLVTIQGAEDVEGKHHTNPYALVLFRGEEKKTEVRLLPGFVQFEKLACRQVQDNARQQTHEMGSQNCWTKNTRQ